MKKIFLIVLGAFILSTSVSAQKLVPLTLNNEDDQPISTGNPKSPTLAPTVYIEDYTLTFENNHPDYILNIKDEEGYVVYLTVVYSTEMQVVLPSILSGDYEIELTVGNLLFTGRIHL